MEETLLGGKVPFYDMQFRSRDLRKKSDRLRLCGEASEAKYSVDLEQEVLGGDEIRLPQP